MNWGGGGMGGDMGKGGVDRMKYVVFMYESLKKKQNIFKNPVLILCQTINSQLCYLFGNLISFLIRSTLVYLWVTGTKSWHKTQLHNIKYHGKVFGVEWSNVRFVAHHGCYSSDMFVPPKTHVQSPVWQWAELADSL